MYILLSIIIGLSMSFLAALLTYIVSRRRIFQEAFIIVERYRIESKPRDKGELRRYKKLKAIVSSARKRLLLLFFIHLTIFMITYVSTIAFTALLVPGDEMTIKIPISIPLLSARTDHMYETHVLFIAFIAYLAPLYLMIRAVRPITSNNKA
jgi:hypothetical protein